MALATQRVLANFTFNIFNIRRTTTSSASGICGVIQTHLSRGVVVTHASKKVIKTSASNLHARRGNCWDGSSEAMISTMSSVFVGSSTHTCLALIFFAATVKKAAWRSFKHAPVKSRHSDDQHEHSVPLRKQGTTYHHNVHWLNSILYEWLQDRAVASWGQWCPAPHLKSVPSHFMFGPRLLHTSNIVFLKCAAPCGFWPPLLGNPGDGPATGAPNWSVVNLKSGIGHPGMPQGQRQVWEQNGVAVDFASASSKLLVLCRRFGNHCVTWRIHSNLRVFRQRNFNHAFKYCTGAVLGLQNYRQ